MPNRDTEGQKATIMSLHGIPEQQYDALAQYCKKESYACDRCGEVGIHACTGCRMSPMTASEKDQLAHALDAFRKRQDPLSDPFIDILNDHLWDLYED